MRRAHPAIRDPATKAQLFRELTERRKAAFALIFDEAKYPYPHPEGPEYQAVQAEVDGLVMKVRVIWERPVAWLIETNPEIRALSSRAEEMALELDRMGSPPAVPFAELLAEVSRAVGIQRFPGDSAAKNALEWNDQALRFNREVKVEADDAERACVDATNEYRMMMGQKAVLWNAKLLTCARAHSTHMREHSYFAHDVPLPGAEFDPIRTPVLRARRAGYSGGVSENIARGATDGRQTMLQWYGSSGHHRNMLGPRHTEIGVGRSEDFWTQNFGSAAQKVELP
ncbi:MAG: CAP domain-containing protein [Planctomycetes bacterium]|nr:CAP domain-containing protein [Planctomycetota bacterium]